MTWKRGRTLLFRQARPSRASRSSPSSSGLATTPADAGAGHGDLHDRAAPTRVPHALLHNLKHNKVLHEQVVLLTILSEDVPHVPRGASGWRSRRWRGLRPGVARYGFKEEPDIPDGSSSAPCSKGLSST